MDDISDINKVTSLLSNPCRWCLYPCGKVYIEFLICNINIMVFCQFYFNNHNILLRSVTLWTDLPTYMKVNSMVFHFVNNKILILWMSNTSENVKRGTKGWAAVKKGSEGRQHCGLNDLANIIYVDMKLFVTGRRNTLVCLNLLKNSLPHFYLKCWQKYIHFSFI